MPQATITAMTTPSLSNRMRTPSPSPIRRAASAVRRNRPTRKPLFRVLGALAGFAADLHPAVQFLQRNEVELGEDRLQQRLISGCSFNTTSMIGAAGRPAARLVVVEHNQTEAMPPSVP